MVVEQLRKLYPQFSWRCRSTSMKAGRILWRGTDDGVTLDVWFQTRCPAIDQKRYYGFASLSRLRLPDIAITFRSPTSQRFIILDAKYRSSRLGVLDGMASAHLYHDSLRWCGRKPDASMLLIPRGGGVSVLESTGYQEAHGVGACVLGHKGDGHCLARMLEKLLMGKAQGASDSLNLGSVKMASVSS